MKNKRYKTITIKIDLSSDNGFNTDLNQVSNHIIKNCSDEVYKAIFYNNLFKFGKNKINMDAININTFPNE